MENKKLKPWEREKILSEYDGESKVISSPDAKAETDKINDNTFSWKLGVPTLDRLLNGVESGELIVVTGPTGHGKTTLLTSITQNIAATVPTVWLTMEMTNRQFLAKFPVLPLFYLPMKNIESHVDWVIDRIIEAKVKYDIKIAFIDHLHQMIMLDHFNGNNMSLEIGDVVSKIKNLAIEYNIVIFMIAHSTDPKESVTREPRMADVRDSGMITRLADTVIGVWRIPNSFLGNETTIGNLEEGDTHAKVRVWKNRREGELGYLIMDMKNKCLVEIDKSFLPEQPKQKKLYDK